MKKTITLFSFLFVIGRLSAQTPTWSDKVAAIIYDNCSSCHHEGGIGPFSLMSYDDALTNGYGISTQVAA
ncbi:MAG: hypothetical protein WBB36_16155, partial [Chitinophagales bacterium]